VIGGGGRTGEVHDLAASLTNSNAVVCEAHGSP
jgi:hypothetical protein